MTLAAYLAELHDAGRASSSASMAVADACFRAKLAGQPTPGWRADRPGCSPATGGPPPIGGEDKRDSNHRSAWLRPRLARFDLASEK